MTQTMCTGPDHSPKLALLLVTMQAYGGRSLQRPACLECVKYFAGVLPMATIDDARLSISVEPMPVCQQCGVALVQHVQHAPASGRPRVWCSESCRKKALRARAQTASH